MVSLENQNIEIAKSIRNVFQASYAIEAAILKVKDFPPLKRPLEDFVSCPNVFFGILQQNELAAVVEVKVNEHNIHIQSLVVHPNYFRQGLGQQLVRFVLNNYKTDTFMVETGFANEPAKNLYKKFNFIEIAQWNTDYGIRKVRFEKKV